MRFLLTIHDRLGHEADSDLRYMGYRKRLPFPVLSAFLCLGQKYDIQSLYVEAREKLYEEFPVTLAGYDKHEDGETWTVIEPPTDTGKHWVLLARKIGLLSILPTILYDFSQFSYGVISSGVKMDDKSTVSLSLQDQIACLDGYRAVCKAQAQETFRWMHHRHPLSEDCLTWKECLASRRDSFVHHFGSMPFPWAFARWKNIETLGLCGPCSKVAEKWHVAGREAMWEQLPLLLHLPPWSELLKERENQYVSNHHHWVLILTCFMHS